MNIFYYAHTQHNHRIKRFTKFDVISDQATLLKPLYSQKIPHKETLFCK